MKFNDNVNEEVLFDRLFSFCYLTNDNELWLKYFLTIRGILGESLFSTLNL